MIEQIDELWLEEIVDEDQWPFVDLASPKGWRCRVCHVTIPETVTTLQLEHKRAKSNPF
jgi:hypothetical protein